MKRILTIYCGPRRSGNTEILLDKVIEGISKENSYISKVILKELNIQPCTACYGCSNTGKCIVYDNMSELYKSIEAADVIILASPIYFGNVSSLGKIMIDRCQSFWCGKYTAKVKEVYTEKKGYFVATAGSNEKKGFRCARYTVKLFFSACGAAYKGELFAGNTDIMEIKNNTYELERALSFGRGIL